MARSAGHNIINEEIFGNGFSYLSYFVRLW